MNSPAHLAPVLWFQGPPLSGKTTLALALQSRLEQEQVACQILDARELSEGINADRPSPEEATRRTAEMAKVMASKGWVTLVTADCPTEAEQAQIGRILADTNLKTILIECPESVLSARAEELGRHWTKPEVARSKSKADLLLKSHVHTPESCLERVLALVDSILHREDPSQDDATLAAGGESEAGFTAKAPTRKGFTPNWEELRSLSQIRAKNERPEDHVKRKRSAPEPTLFLGMSGSMLLNVSLLVAGALGLGFLISQVRENYERGKKENGAVEQSMRVRRALENGIAPTLPKVGEDLLIPKPFIKPASPRPPEKED
jgi:DNA polymerase III delta prime subunit